MAHSILTVIHWWFGLSYLLVGVIGVVGGPIMISLGNYGGVYFIIGGAITGVAGWAIHPWGLQRQTRAT